MLTDVLETGPLGPGLELPLRRCALCQGTFVHGPLGGHGFPPCLACRDALSAQGVAYDTRTGRLVPAPN